MKRVITNLENENLNDVFGMANLTKRKTGLSVDIWSDHKGIERHKQDKYERVKITYNDASISISISPNPEILAKSNVKQSDWKYLNKGIDYVARNYDLFQKHYEDTNDEFDDEDLFSALRERGEYK